VVVASVQGETERDERVLVESREGERRGAENVKVGENIVL
jgi:hypothetical protein